MQLSQFRKKVSWVAILMVLQRTPYLPWAKNAVLFAGSMIDKVWTWKMALPVAATAGGWHSLSGATSYVSSSQSNSATVREGESYSFKFRTTGYLAYSYSVVGLPNGLSYNGSYSSPTISGTPDTPGTYTIGITGFRRSGQKGDSTATYYLSLNVEENEVLDTDGDGFSDENDIDDDGDGVLDIYDAFPLDATETLDTDGDGTGNNADTDDDEDGVIDSADAFPLDDTETLDSDGDGTGNNADTDDDGDGVNDSDDAFPLDPSKSVSTTQEQEETNEQDESSTETSSEEITQSVLEIWSDSNTTDLGSGWFNSSWFGNFYGNSGGWTYHLKHEWIFLAETSNGGLWIYDDSLGWLYTEKGVYPYLHRNSNGHWLYDLSTISERKFWDATLETEITP